MGSDNNVPAGRKVPSENLKSFTALRDRITDKQRD
jgi:hypothetical protein